MKKKKPGIILSEKERTKWEDMTLKNATYKGNQFKSSWRKLDGEERNVGKNSNKTKQFSMNQGKTGFFV